MLLTRLLLTKNVEVYKLSETLYGDIHFYMIFMDFRRPSIYEDFSYIRNFKKEDFDSRGNYIQALIIYNKKMTEEEEDLTFEIASGFLEDKDDCHWSLKYLKGDFEKLEFFGENLISNINEFLMSNGYKNSINIDPRTYKYILQE